MSSIKTATFISGVLVFLSPIAAGETDILFQHTLDQLEFRTLEGSVVSGINGELVDINQPASVTCQENSSTVYTLGGHLVDVALNQTRLTQPWTHSSVSLWSEGYKVVQGKSGVYRYLLSPDSIKVETKSEQGQWGGVSTYKREESQFGSFSHFSVSDDGLNIAVTSESGSYVMLFSFNKTDSTLMLQKIYDTDDAAGLMGASRSAFHPNNQLLVVSGTRGNALVTFKNSISTHQWRLAHSYTSQSNELIQQPKGMVFAPPQNYLYVTLTRGLLILEVSQSGMVPRYGVVSEAVTDSELFFPTLTIKPFENPKDIWLLNGQLSVKVDNGLSHFSISAQGLLQHTASWSSNNENDVLSDVSDLCLNNQTESLFMVSKQSNALAIVSSVQQALTEVPIATVDTTHSAEGRPMIWTPVLLMIGLSLFL
ncbi:hypothetical protein [Endozoicomonas sp. OPT23]|uniref:hypothetical protein n=1 Tax=Endozoicomonas sp. OPT23 TaxID=2072845 RepID=UPI00129A27B5|nr:hypothetical protein [Endozoicomonas sp. OPT23]